MSAHLAAAIEHAAHHRRKVSDDVAAHAAAWHEELTREHAAKLSQTLAPAMAVESQGTDTERSK